MRKEQRITVVIPCYNVERHIEGVVKAVPDFVDHIILVDDASKDGTRQLIDNMKDVRVIPLHHEQNQGVGGAMLTGYRKAMELGDGMVVKIDGDGQMDCAMIAPLIDSMAPETDMAKGNRLFNLAALKTMPRVRRFGNGVLGFMVKAASGYWEISDPVNGFFAIRTSTLRKMDLGRVAKDYFFESSMIIEMYYAGAHIRELPMPAIYGDEQSNLSIRRTLAGFPPRLVKAWLRRIRLCYFTYDFNMGSLYLATGLPCLLFGLIFGICRWVHFASMAQPAPTGTIMLAVITFVLGFQMLLAAVQYDITHKNPFGGVKS